MAYINRVDGEHFVIPSYRDVITAKQKSQLKKTILSLSQSYGEYITLQKKGTAGYEVAFSPDTGYLLGESIWQHFKRPLDLIYCEAIPNTTEAILVIVKDGSVYLDGSFPVDSIPEELVIFLTQESNFEIYTYGDVPISEQPDGDKFSFESHSVKSFTVLEKPVFPTVALLKQYQLQPVEAVLKINGIGVFPLKALIFVFLALGLTWMLWSYLYTPKVEVIEEKKVNPYQPYIDKLNAPAPDREISAFLKQIEILYSMPGWTANSIEYSNGNAVVSVTSDGGSIQGLIDWAKPYKATVDVQPTGIFLHLGVPVPKRPAMVPLKIYPIKETIVQFTDNLAQVYPGNVMKLDKFNKMGLYTDVTVTINIDNVSPAIVSLIGDQFANLPCVLRTMSLKLANGNISGIMTLEVLGN